MFNKKQILSILLWSLLGSFIIFFFHSFTTRGPISTIPPYIFVMIGAMFFFKPGVNSFKLYFIYGLSIFMMISIFGIIYILSFVNPAALNAPLSHWVKVTCMMLTIGIPSASLLAGVTYFIKKKLVLFHTR